MSILFPTQKEAGALALWAGVDMDITYEPAYMGPLIENVEEGKVSEALVDRAVRRVLALKFRLGLFEHPYVDVAQAERVVHSQEHQQLALRTARESIVLLKNENNVLPLKKDLKSIAVIGPNADNGWSQLGDYSPSAVPQKVTTILDGIRQKVTPGTRVEYVRGCQVIGGGKEDFARAVEAARKASVAVVAVGENPRNAGSGDVPATDGEGYDVATLDLTGYQGDLVKAIQATGTPVVLVLINGRPLSDPLGGSSYSGDRRGMGAGRARRRGGRGCALWRLQPQRTSGHHDPAQHRTATRLLQLQAFKRILDASGLVS